jgi:mannosidase alpha-like ER degradation enhancer 1
MLTLRALNCAARDGTQDEHEINDVMGGYALTLIDALGSFVVLGDKDGFDRSVRLVVDDIHNFDIDARVQVFEVTIRVLGGLVRLFPNGRSVQARP